MAQQTDDNKMKSTQTTVDWLKDMLEWNYGNPQMLEISWENLDDLLERAKQMEKEQMIDLIRFLRIQDKMGKSVEDLYEQYKKK